MFWKHTSRPLEIVTRTGFHVSIVSYLVFWLADLLQPGFVSRYFSVHAFLLAAIIFGVLWSWCMQEYVERPWLQGVVLIAFGVFLSMITWSLTKDLEMYRLLIVLLCFFTPWIIYRLIKT